MTGMVWSEAPAKVRSLSSHGNWEMEHLRKTFLGHKPDKRLIELLKRFTYIQRGKEFTIMSFLMKLLEEMGSLLPYLQRKN